MWIVLVMLRGIVALRTRQTKAPPASERAGEANRSIGSTTDQRSCVTLDALVSHSQIIRVGKYVKIRSELTQISIHLGAAGTHSQVAVKLHASIKDHSRLVITVARIAPIV